MLSFFQRDVLDETLDLIESVSEAFLPTLIIGTVVPEDKLFEIVDGRTDD